MLRTNGACPLSPKALRASQAPPGKKWPRPPAQQHHQARGLRHGGRRSTQRADALEAEIGQHQAEVVDVYRAVVLEVALRPRPARLAEIGQHDGQVVYDIDRALRSGHRRGAYYSTVSWPAAALSDQPGAVSPAAAVELWILPEAQFAGRSLAFRSALTAAARVGPAAVVEDHRAALNVGPAE